MKQLKLGLLDFFIYHKVFVVLVFEAVPLTTLGPPSGTPHIQLYEHLKSSVKETVKIVVS